MSARTLETVAKRGRKIKHIDKPCAHCGKAIPRRPTYARAVYCGNECRALAASYTPEVAQAAFWSRVNKDTPTGCWEYTGARDKWGYGDIRYLKKHVQAHRLSWRLLKGEPGELDVLHKCHNPPCCNPDHLYLGTDADNIRDKVEAGRHDFGERCGRSKLKEVQVIEIKGKLAAGVTQRALAAEYGVAQTTIAGISIGRSWKHLL